MNKLTDTINEKQEMNDVPVILVKRMKNKKGREIFLSELEINVPYYLKIEKTPTFSIKYISGLIKKEIVGELLYHKESNPHNKLRVYVAPVKRN